MANNKRNKIRRRIQNALKLRELFPMRLAIERAFPDPKDALNYMNSLIEELE